MLKSDMKYLLVILLFCSCMTLRRAEKKIIRLTERFPALLKEDTLTISDTTFIDAIEADTAFLIDFDTITLEKEKLVIRVIRENDTIYLEGKVKPEVIVKTHYIPITKTVVVKPTKWKQFWRSWGWLIWLLIFITIIYFFKQFIREVIKKILSKRLKNP